MPIIELVWAIIWIVQWWHLSRHWSVSVCVPRPLIRFVSPWVTDHVSWAVTCLDIEEVGGSYLDLNDKSISIRIYIETIYFFGPENQPICPIMDQTAMSVIFLHLLSSFPFLPPLFIFFFVLFSLPTPYCIKELEVKNMKHLAWIFVIPWLNKMCDSPKCHTWTQCIALKRLTTVWLFGRRQNEVKRFPWLMLKW